MTTSRARRFPRVPPGLQRSHHAARAVLSPVPNLPGSLVLCALSGGADSCVLLVTLAGLAPRLGFTVRAVHVVHGLVSSPSLRDAATCVAHQAQVPLDVISVTVPAHTGLGPEASARSVRQEALARAMEGTGATFLALGHTATDVAETFLQRLLEGAGRGQGPMPAVERGRLRPLVGVTRAQVRDAATALHLPFVDDQANEDPTVLRAFFRQELWPHLERRFGSPDLTLARACQAAQEDHDALERWATACQDGAGLGRGVLQGVPDAVAHRAVRHLVEAAAGMPVRTGGEAVRKAVQAARAAGGPVRRYKAGPVWLVVDRVDVRAEAGTPAPGAASAGAGAACYGPTANTDPGDGSRVSADAGKAG